MPSAAPAPADVDVAWGRGPSVESAAAEYRYGLVFLVVFAVVIFVIVVPTGAAARASAFALASGALLIAISTSRAQTAVRRRRVLTGFGAAFLLTLGIATDLVGNDVTFLLTALVTVAIPVSLGRGLLRLVREHGANLQSVLGGLAVYLTIGLTFAAAISFVAAVGHGNYYAQGTNGSPSDHVYYSFTVLTTTGFGDLTAAHNAGRALAVMEMLVGQIYLVTVIGVLIGRRVEKARAG